MRGGWIWTDIKNNLEARGFKTEIVPERLEMVIHVSPEALSLYWNRDILKIFKRYMGRRVPAAFAELVSLRRHCEEEIIKKHQKEEAEIKELAKNTNSKIVTISDKQAIAVNNNVSELIS